MYNSKYLEVNSDDVGLRLDKFLFKNFSNIPYSIIQKKLEQGYLRLTVLEKSKL